VARTMNVYEKLQQARIKLQNAKLKKSGKNAYSGFTYFELADFIPTVNVIFDELKLCSNFSIIDNLAKLQIINAEKIDEITTFTMPTAELQLKGCTAIQALGGVNTYCRRYLYLNALEIVESDMLDAKAGNIEENNDTDIIEGLKATDTIKNLNAYFNKYKDNIVDLKAYQKAYTEHVKILKQKESINV
jgi:hypothetical protein